MKWLVETKLSSNPSAGNKYTALNIQLISVPLEFEYCRFHLDSFNPL